MINLENPETKNYKNIEIDNGKDKITFMPFNLEASLAKYEIIDPKETAAKNY